MLAPSGGGSGAPKPSPPGWTSGTNGSAPPALGAGDTGEPGAETGAAELRAGGVGAVAGATVAAGAGPGAPMRGASLENLTYAYPPMRMAKIPIIPGSTFLGIKPRHRLSLTICDVNVCRCLSPACQGTLPLCRKPAHLKRMRSPIPTVGLRGPTSPVRRHLLYDTYRSSL